MRRRAPAARVCAAAGDPSWRFSLHTIFDGASLCGDERP